MIVAGFLVVFAIGGASGGVVGAQVWRLARCQQLSSHYAAALTSSSSTAFRDIIPTTRDAYQRECS
jgi:hypothetical protein